MWFNSDIDQNVFLQAWQACLEEQQRRYTIKWNRYGHNPKYALIWSRAWDACCKFLAN